MTRLQTRLDTAAPTLESTLRIALDRSARGNATRRDWERVADIDRDVAERELRELLRRESNAGYVATNPYERGSRFPGTMLGFIGGVLLVAAIWLAIPWFRDRWIETPIWRDVATSFQFISTLLIPLGVYAGSKWRSREVTDMPEHPRVGADTSFEDLLDAFERTRNIGRARVY